MQKGGAMSLKKAYEKYFRIGTSVSHKNLADKKAIEELKKHYSSITCENNMKPMFFLDEEANCANPEKYNLTPALRFEYAQPFLEFAKDNGLVLRGHTLVWHNQTGDWFFKENYSKEEDAALASREVMLARMENYIKGVLEYTETNFPGVIYAWDVVNEAIEETNPDGWRDSLWIKTIGKDFVVQAFHFARKYAGREVKLFYNDYNAFWPQKMEYIISNILKPLCKDGLVDGMGMQTHLVRDESNLNDYEKAVGIYGAMGIEIQATEVDIHVTDPKEEGMQVLADMYRRLFEIYINACREGKARVTAVVFWGMKDDESWLTGFRKERSYPLLFGDNWEEKIAYDAVMKVAEK